jgi:rhodanese-related sulfurtransferase
MSTIMARERATLDKNLEQALHPVDLLELLGVRDAGSQILGVRDGADYAKRHLEGSVNIGLSGQYATWPAHCSTVRSPSLIVAEPGREQEAAVRLGRIGFDGVKGYLQGGMQALAGRADLLRSTERISAPELNQELTGVNPPLLLDVRSPREWAAKHIESRREYCTQSIAGATRRTASRPANCDPLCRRLPVVDWCEHPASAWHYGFTGTGGRLGGLGGRFSQRYR